LRHSLQAFVLCIGLAAALSLPLGSAVAGIPAGPVIGTGYNSANASGWVGGAHGGYQWQNGSAVYGFETDLSATTLNSSMTGTLTFPPPFPRAGVTSTNASINWYGTVRGRLGVTTGPLLFYGTGGLAYGQVYLNSSVGLSDSLINSSTSSTRVGWVGGVGMDYMYRPDLIFSLIYQYVDLGTLNLASAAATPVPLGQSASAHAQFQTVMAGFSFRFAPTGASAPWQGGYGGGHVGGAWGLSTDANYAGGLFR
jgi:outer membrane immunogenic protein